MTEIRERRHHLSPGCYIGFVTAAFTMSFKKRFGPKTLLFAAGHFKAILESVIEKHRLFVPAYCFMPTHQHIIFSGVSESSNLRKAANLYKQKTGFFLSKKHHLNEWQKNYYDEIIRTRNSYINQVRYVLENPVKAKLVADWREYPHLGVLGCRLEDILAMLYE
jgi:REP element-mobilizing transposase RayT